MVKELKEMIDKDIYYKKLCIDDNFIIEVWLENDTPGEEPYFVFKIDQKTFMDRYCKEKVGEENE